MNASGAEPVESGQVLDRRISVRIAVDFSPEVAQFIVERLFANLDPPGFQATIASVRAALSARFQVVLHVEEAVLGKDPDTRKLACCNVRLRKNHSST